MPRSGADYPEKDRRHTNKAGVASFLPAPASRAQCLFAERTIS